MEQEKPLRDDTHVLRRHSRLSISNAWDPRAAMTGSCLVSQLIYPAGKFV